MDIKHTPIADIGEFGLIDRIQQIVNVAIDDASLHDHLIKGISDDAAVIRPPSGKVQLLTTDALVEGVHFDLTFTSMRHLGWKAMVASMSDIAAMGGIPRYAVVVLSLPAKISLEMVEEFYAGATASCRKYICMIIGGDITASLAHTTVAVTLLGEVEETNILYRHGAKPGDYLCVSGHLGGSYAGLKILQHQKGLFHKAQQPTEFQPNLEPYAPSIQRHLMPQPRLDISKLLTTRVTIHSLIDISDGLASEVHHLCQDSAVGASVYEHNIPVHSNTQLVASKFSESVIEYALYGGEEYELLFTLDDKEYEKLEGLTDDVTIIGRIIEKEKGIIFVRENGESEPLSFGGWNHFK